MRTKTKRHLRTKQIMSMRTDQNQPEDDVIHEDGTNNTCEDEPNP